jgi:hypothetical protein
VTLDRACPWTTCTTPTAPAAAGSLGARSRFRAGSPETTGCDGAAALFANRNTPDAYVALASPWRCLSRNLGGKFALSPSIFVSRSGLIPFSAPVASDAHALRRSTKPPTEQARSHPASARRSDVLEFFAGGCRKAVKTGSFLRFLPRRSRQMWIPRRPRHNGSQSASPFSAIHQLELDETR